MIKTEEKPEIRRAVVSLVTLACEVRPDWNAADVQGAIVAAATAGWLWPRVLVEVARLMVDPDGAPRDLVHASQDPVRRRVVPADPERHADALAEAREACADGAAKLKAAEVAAVDATFGQVAE